jgi:hypothetical protein
MLREFPNSQRKAFYSQPRGFPIPNAKLFTVNADNNPEGFQFLMQSFLQSMQTITQRVSKCPMQSFLQSMQIQIPNAKIFTVDADNNPEVSKCPMQSFLQSML